MSTNNFVTNFLLFFIAVTISLNAQSKKETYIVELDTSVNLKSYTLSDGYLDHFNLINSKNVKDKKSDKRLVAVAEFFEKIKPLSIRKFIRRLPEDVTYLTTATGKKFNVEGYQKLLVIETDTKIDVNTLNNDL
ncbi:hypothetical protein ACSSWA_07425 [Melioribacter sp. Ez-97]|uniref:hypothetical protein n=1 Tax=Melioribacter sp. Ez-97 TaxID=3423434 RepID=UPI003ED98FD0